MSVCDGFVQTAQTYYSQLETAKEKLDTRKVWALSQRVKETTKLIVNFGGCWVEPQKSPPEKKIPPNPGKNQGKGQGKK